MHGTAADVWRCAQVRELDRLAIQSFGVPGYTLMTRAGEAAFRHAAERWPRARRWLVLCGGGNNAGDGFVVARLAAQAGLQVTVATLADPAGLAGDAARAFGDFQAGGGRAAAFTAADLTGTELVVDALLGTGLARAVQGPWAEAIRAVNAARLPVVALDLPSGLDGDSGLPLGAAIRADLTVTFVARKTGLYLGAGPDHCGAVVLEELGVPGQAHQHLRRQATPALRVFAEKDWRASLPPREPAAHKGDFGHVLVLGGNDGMPGAVRLAAEAALRTGAGLVSVATRPANAPLVAAARPELMCTGIGARGGLGPLLDRATVVACGPGLGQDDWAGELLAAALAAGRPLVLDADALNLLSRAPLHREDWILTPHPGEAGRLLGVGTAEVQADRLGALHQLVARYGGTIVLKGRCTLVGQAGRVPWVIDRGNPGMATAGMGDVLTGIIAGLAAQAGALDAGTAATGAFVHGAAGDTAAGPGQRGLLASDLFPALRPWLNPSN